MATSKRRPARPAPPPSPLNAVDTVTHALRDLSAYTAAVTALIEVWGNLRDWIGHGHAHAHPADILREIDRALLDQVDRAVEAVGSFPALDADTLRSEVIDAVTEQINETAYETKEAAARVVLDANPEATREEIAVEIRCIG